MKRFLACLALCASLSASAQVVYPYNPDANGDSAITSGDLLDFLPVFATTFTPQGITIDGVPLDEWLADLEAVVNNLQAQLNAQDATIDSLQNAAMTRDSVADIAVGVAWRGELAGANLTGAYLQIAELPGADLSGANLSGANLTGAYLDGANLQNADLTGAGLSAANISYANLSGANLTGANLSGAALSYADLSGADLSGAILEVTGLQNANLTGANLSGAILWGAELPGADLSGANLDGATMTCLHLGCPSQLPSGYICEPNPDCSYPNSYRIVPE